MDMNPNYEEATMALNFTPEDMGATQNSNAPSIPKLLQCPGLRLEEQFERSAAVKLHEAEAKWTTWSHSAVASHGCINQWMNLDAD
eukprot:Skav228402  [mRNA]  locus=scaffold1911:275718:276344:+ [translate_table: standard]